MFVITMQVPDGRYVTYARFNGDECEDIGFTTDRSKAGKFDAYQRRLIRRYYNRMQRVAL